MIIYISLPLHGHTEEDCRRRCQRAVSYIADVLSNKFRESIPADIGPINIETPFSVADVIRKKAEEECARAAMFNPDYAKADPIPDIDYLLADLRVISRSNLVIALDGWQSSRGCLAEVAFAKSRGVAVLELSEGLSFCRWATGTLGRLDEAADMGRCFAVADAFITSFYQWRDRQRKRFTDSPRLDRYAVDDLPF